MREHDKTPYRGLAVWAQEEHGNLSALLVCQPTPGRLAHARTRTDQHLLL